MDFDDLVIGSGVAALGSVLGLLGEPGRRVGVLCGPAENRFHYYDQRGTLPCAFLGEGGLGSHWHGVIPTGFHNNFGGASHDDFTALFETFYPRAGVRGRLGEPSFFVPWRPIRPAAELERLAARESGNRPTLIHEPALDVRFDGQGASVQSLGKRYRASRVWVAAGVLQTPQLLQGTFGTGVARGLVSDHAFCYVGQVAGQEAPAVTRSRDGVFFPATYDAAFTALYTLRPAAFDFARLDHGIEQRAVFGMPTGSALAKIARRLSPGLLVEAFYNRFGLLGGSAMHSVYAQVPVADAYVVQGDGDAIVPVKARLDRIRRATDKARRMQPFAGLVASRRPELHLPGIHLHHSLDLAALAGAGINTQGSPVQVVDASILTDIGPDHHSFKMMLAAKTRASACASVAASTVVSPRQASLAVPQSVPPSASTTDSPATIASGA